LLLFAFRFLTKSTRRANSDLRLHIAAKDFGEVSGQMGCSIRSRNSSCTRRNLDVCSVRKSSTNVMYLNRWLL